MIKILLLAIFSRKVHDCRIEINKGGLYAQ